MWYFSLAKTYECCMIPSSRLVALRTTKLQVPIAGWRYKSWSSVHGAAWNSDTAALVINKRGVTWLAAAIAAMPKRYHSGAASADTGQVLLLGDHRPRLQLQSPASEERVRWRLYRGRRRRQSTLQRMAADPGVLAGLGFGKESYGANRSVYL
jgi:hypothetical protein